MVPLKLVLKNGICLAVITASENVNEQIEMPFSITVFEKSFPLNSMWGDSAVIKVHIEEHFNKVYASVGMPNK